MNATEALKPRFLAQTDDLTSEAYATPEGSNIGQKPFLVRRTAADTYELHAFDIDRSVLFETFRDLALNSACAALDLLDDRIKRDAAEAAAESDRRAKVLASWKTPS